MARQVESMNRRVRLTAWLGRIRLLGWVEEDVAPDQLPASRFALEYQLIRSRFASDTFLALVLHFPCEGIHGSCCPRAQHVRRLGIGEHGRICSKFAIAVSALVASAS